jgi:hypothetical protein
MTDSTTRRSTPSSPVSYPHNVRAIVIRQLSPSQAVLAGGRSEGIMSSTPGIPWVYASDGGRIAERLQALGLLTPPPQLRRG